MYMAPPRDLHLNLIVPPSQHLFCYIRPTRRKTVVVVVVVIVIVIVIVIEIEIIIVIVTEGVPPPYRLCFIAHC